MYNSTMITSRERIFNYIEKYHTVTSGDISTSFGVTRANVRYHLDILLHQGLIEIVGKRISRRKGRPDLLYSVSKLNRRNNLDYLSNAILKELKRQFPEKINEIFKAVAVTISNSVRSVGIEDIQSDEVKQLSQVLRTTIEHLDELNYQAHWEAHAEGPRIILKNCPYQQIEPQHPDICQLDRYLIEYLSNSRVNQIGKLEPDERNIPHCIFEVFS